MLQQLKAPKLPFRELDMLVKAIGECRSKSEEDRIITAEVDTLKHRLSDPKLDKTRGREYMVRVIYCEMLGHDASFAYIPALQLASDPNLLVKKVRLLTSFAWPSCKQLPNCIWPAAPHGFFCCFCKFIGSL